MAAMSQHRRHGSRQIELDRDLRGVQIGVDELTVS